MNEQDLIEKLRLIEALFSGTTSTGEKVAAELARERILKRLRGIEKEEPLVEYRFSMSDMWTRKVFVALLRRYGIIPYRYPRQRYTTVMARVSKRFVDETLWPEFQEISKNLEAYLAEITERVISQVIHQDCSEAEVVKEPPMLSSGQDAASTESEPVPDLAGQSGHKDHNTAAADNKTRRKTRGSKKKKKKKKGR